MQAKQPLQMLKLFLELFLFTILSFSCQNSEKKKKSEFINNRNKNIIDFKTETVMNMDELINAGEKRYKEISSSDFNKKTDTLSFKNQQIYISYLALVNGCAKYSGDFKIINDSLFLKLFNIGENECTEQRVDRVIFKIDNKENRQYTIVKW